MANRGGKVETVTDFIFLDSKITADGNYKHEIKRHLVFGRKAMTNLDNLLKNRGITLGPYSQSYSFFNNHVQMWELVHKRCWASKKNIFELWCWRRLESPLDYKEIQSVKPKRDQCWIFTKRTEAEAPILWPSDMKNQLNGKDPDWGWSKAKGKGGIKGWNG